MGVSPLAGDRAERLCKKATHIYILAMLTVFPLFTGPKGYVFFNEKKFAFFAVCTACWALFLLYQTAARAFKVKNLVPVQWLTLAFMCACVASFIRAGASSFLSLSTGRCDGLVTWLLYGCIFLGVSRYGKAHRGYLHALGLSYTLCCVVALLQICGLNPLRLYPNRLTLYSNYVRETGAFLGTVGNVDLFSALICLVIPIMCAGLLIGRGRARLFYAIPAALGVACLVASGVTSGLLALTCTAAVFLPAAAVALYDRRHGADGNEKSRKRLLAISIFIVTAAAVAALLLIAFLPVKGGFLSELQNLLHGRLEDSFGSHRVLIWRKTLEIVRPNLLVGVGPDQLGAMLDLSFSRYSELLGRTLTTWVDNAHNEYLNLLVSFGLCGFLPCAAASVLTWVKALGCKRSFTKMLRPGLLCYMIQAFFNIGLCITTPVFLILFALVWSGDWK